MYGAGVLALVAETLYYMHCTGTWSLYGERGVC